jgi:hypothetical protein
MKELSGNANDGDDEAVSAEVHSFMLAEFESIYQNRNQLSTITNSEIQMFLLILSALIVGISFVRESALVSQEGFLVVCSVATTLAFILGLSTFYRNVQARVQIFTYTRALNRIRRFYVVYDKRIADYLMMPTSHRQPSFTSVGQNDRYISQIMNAAGILALVTSSIFTCAVLSIISLLHEASILPYLQVPFVTISCILSLIVSTLILLRWQHVILSNAEEHQRNKFAHLLD